MDKRTIAIRFAAVPLCHKFAAATIAIGVTAASILYMLIPVSTRSETSSVPDTIRPIVSSPKQRLLDLERDTDRTGSQPTKEEALLKLTVAMLDSKLNGLETELDQSRSKKEQSKGNEQRPIYGNQARSSRPIEATEHGDDLQPHLISGSAVVSPAGNSTAQGQFESAATMAGERRSNILKLIANVRNQQALIKNRLKETQHEEALARNGVRSAGTPVANNYEARTAPEVKLDTKPQTPGTPDPANFQPLATLVANTGQDGSIARLGAVSNARKYGERQYLMGLLGIIVGWMLGLSYFAAAFWRFRPIDDAAVLKELLPGDVLFLSTIGEIR